ncbi:hypothetical protein H6G33_36575 [Calothrix sp. FACHB-1219]|uniref:hypothetical protein n=1 Tax=unclassified Calothrix TaxID=2619626 RepID=UPI001686C4B6|nr:MULTISPECIES: hypothetical protein [unclassified Calothrix]MBD2207816.1 hypothetical protein [Calothrix sp. FACHB-168]MBD2222448.1 hypothetical protein [Calothrix sp. FACHB-1219]
MAITVYSQTFQRELDVEQLLSLLGYNNELDINARIKKLSKQENNKIYNDVICPICGCKGGSIVTASISKQAHFRFKDHNYFCDYNFSKENKSQKGKSVDFGDERSNETKIIRELVTKGIEQKIISQQLISEMRKYFYDTKIQNQYKMDISTEALDWCINLRNSKYSIAANFTDIKFNPVYTQLPNFDWKLAAKSLFIEENANLIEIANNCFLRTDKNLIDKVRKKIQDTQEYVVFDVSKLEIPYKNTIKFAQFITVNFSLQDKKTEYYLINSDIVMAFAALLLYAVNWNIEFAILNLIKIVQSPQSVDMNSGNIIGLNPFYDFEVWSIIAKIREVLTHSKNGINYQDQIELIEAQLKNECELRKSLNQHNK